MMIASYFRPKRKIKTVKKYDLQETRRSGSDFGSFRVFVAKHASLLFQAIFLVLGTVVGAVSAGKMESSIVQSLDLLFYTDFSSRLSRSYSVIFISSVSSSFLFLLTCFLFGLSLWGMFLIPVVPFLRGFGSGLVGGYLYMLQGVKGVLFYILEIVPGTYLCMLGILFAAKESTFFSKELAFRVLSKTEIEYKVEIGRYFTRFGMIMVFILLSAILDVITAWCFSGLFAF